MAGRNHQARIKILRAHNIGNTGRGGYMQQVGVAAAGG